MRGPLFDTQSWGGYRTIQQQEELVRKNKGKRSPHHSVTQPRERGRFVPLLPELPGETATAELTVYGGGAVTLTVRGPLSKVLRLAAMAEQVSATLSQASRG